MSLADTLKQDMKAAMKAKDSATLSTLRLLLSAIKNKQIDVQHDLSDEEIQGVIKTQVKQLKDSATTFTEGGREDMANDALEEAARLEKYLPAQMEDAELETIVKQVIEQTGAQSKADMGKVMGAAMKAVEGRADGGRVKNMVGTLLGAFLPLALAAVAMDAGAIEIVETVSSGSAYAEFLLRITRVLMLWIGIVAITLILNGAFMYATASLRDDVHTEALGKISQGVFASIIVAGLFAFITVILQQIG